MLASPPIPSGPPRFGRVQELAAAAAAPCIAAGTADGTVAIYDLAQGRERARFATVLAFGGPRLALGRDGEVCIAAGYDANGIAAYRAADGAVLWQREDLTEADVLSVSAAGTTVFAGFSDGPAHELDLRTGRTLQTLRGVERVVPGTPELGLFVKEARAELRRAGSRRPLVLQGEGPGVMAACFAAGAVFVARFRGPVHRYSLQDGTPEWRYRPPRDSHVVQLAASTDETALYAVEFDCERARSRLLRIDSARGSAVEVAALGRASAELLVPNAGVVVEGDGRVMRLADGVEVSRLPWVA